MLVVGNLMHTGQHGIHFDAKGISQQEFMESLFKAVEQLKTIIKKEHQKRIRVIMLKDFFDEDPIHADHGAFDTLKLHTLSVQPNMILDIPPNWIDSDAYLSVLNKKYRQRYKTARKKAGYIVKKEMDLDDIGNQSDRLYELYKNVSDHAKINTFILPKGHFFKMKSHLKENFKVLGYYLDGALIGFYTLILNNDALETYFLGYDEEHQYPNQIYLNMLFDMVDFAIANKFKSVVYARTAMEIKSSIGAKPQKMVVYLKHTNIVMNTFLKPIFKLMDPTQKWEERHPFK